jgi:hypothetical protein
VVRQTKGLKVLGMAVNPVCERRIGVWSFFYLDTRYICADSHEYEYEYKCGGCARQPFHHDHSLIYCAFAIFPIWPVVPYLLWSTVSHIVESCHSRLFPLNVYLSDEALIQLNPHTHIGYMRLYQHGCYRMPWLLFAPGTTLSHLRFWALSWYIQTPWSFPGEACLL